VPAVCSKDLLTFFFAALRAFGFIGIGVSPVLGFSPDIGSLEFFGLAGYPRGRGMVLNMSYEYLGSLAIRIDGALISAPCVALDWNISAPITAPIGNCYQRPLYCARHKRAEVSTAVQFQLLVHWTCWEIDAGKKTSPNIVAIAHVRT